MSIVQEIYLVVEQKPKVQVSKYYTANGGPALEWINRDTGLGAELLADFEEVNVITVSLIGDKSYIRYMPPPGNDVRKSYKNDERLYLKVVRFLSDAKNDYDKVESYLDRMDFIEFPG